jgi:fructosamine-3-kinase
MGLLSRFQLSLFNTVWLYGANVADQNRKTKREDNMEINLIIQELLVTKILKSNPINYKQLSGGTVSQLYLLEYSDGSNYVVKQNEPQVIQSEAFFLTNYKDIALLPQLLFVETSNKYMVYSFIDGSTQFARKNKKEMLGALVQGLINNYRIVTDPPGWGWAEQPTQSWMNFLLDEILDANHVLESHLEEEDFNLVRNLVENPKRKSLTTAPFLLHGDCGVHNFIFENGQLNGVIDPMPVIGDPLYDLIYAFCSSPDDLTKETIDFAVSQLNLKGYQINSFLYEDVVIGLYLRIRTCIIHHPDDFEDYLKAWQYWKDILKNSD